MKEVNLSATAKPSIMNDVFWYLLWMLLQSNRGPAAYHSCWVQWLSECGQEAIDEVHGVADAIECQGASCIV